MSCWPLTQCNACPLAPLTQVEASLPIGSRQSPEIKLIGMLMYGKCSLLILTTTLIGCNSFSTKPEQGRVISGNPATTPAVITAYVSNSAPVAQAMPLPPIMTIAERKERVRELLKDSPQTPEELEEIVHHISIMSKTMRGYTAELKLARDLLAHLPKGEALVRARQVCADIERAVPAMTEVLKQALHDPSSFQDFKVEKCAVLSELVQVRASYRAKNGYGALVLNEERFLVVRDNSDKLGFKAYVIPD